MNVTRMILILCQKKSGTLALNDITQTIFLLMYIIILYGGHYNQPKYSPFYAQTWDIILTQKFL